MKVFISWSGEASNKIARLLRDWIPSVLQSAEVYVSSLDISKGDRWLPNITTKLAEHNYGIAILTPSNVEAPWIMYEAGAIAKSIDGRLMPFLCGVSEVSLLKNPLSQFQYVKAPDQSEILRSVLT